MDFHFLQTEDGSPSLKLGENAEPMHNSKGAFAETVYIYGHAICYALQNLPTPSFLSLGLGLGYNEMLTTALLLKTKTPLEQVYGESFEAVAELNQNFLKWLNNDSIDTNFKAAYDQICSLCASHSDQDTEKIKSTLKNLIEGKQWLLRRALEPSTIFDQRFSCFLFDAFSSKTSPDLWQEDFLTDFFDRTANDEAVLATYAFTGTLKRSLQKRNFEVESRPGFGGKRESTFAIRGKQT